MIAVIFEVIPHDRAVNRYLEIAASLKEQLHDVDGFVSVERFQSLTQPEKYLSLSFFRDEEAVKAWRNAVDHRSAQSKGRQRVFSDYRIRVAQVMRDYSLNNRDEAPVDSQTVHKE